MGRENEADVCRSHSRLFVPCRGWGLRTLDDIPKGSFVCTYIGHIYTEQGGEEVSRSFTFQVSFLWQQHHHADFVAGVMSGDVMLCNLI